MNTKFTVKAHYFATGEGVTTIIAYYHAKDSIAALKRFHEEFGLFMVRGAEVEEGFDTESDIARFLVSENKLKILNAEGFVEYSAKSYMNFS